MVTPQCSETYTKTIFQPIFIFTFNKVFILSLWDRFFDEKFNFDPISFPGISNPLRESGESLKWISSKSNV